MLRAVAATGSRQVDQEAQRLQPSRWRRAVVRATLLLPRALREGIWSARRARARSHRRALEARGDYTLSMPALYEMDKKLAKWLDFDNGFFVEAGANDGYRQSNTYWFERARNWRGVLIEPVPALYREAVRERVSSRVFNCALVANDFGDGYVKLLYGGLMTTVAGTRASSEADRAWVEAAHAVVQEMPRHEFAVPACTLSSILDEVGAGTIDLLSLDVEGYEGQVLAGLDLDRHAPRYILVEVREGASARADIEAVLGARYVAVDHLSPYDVLYRLETAEERS